MKNAACIVSAVIITLALMALPAWAACPEGKNAITMITPSGMQKTLCVPDNAVKGIENAAENSGTTVIPATCPCWSTKELESAFQTDSFTCTITSIAPYSSSCISDYSGQYLFVTWEKDIYMGCYNYSAGIKYETTANELEACNASIAAYGDASMNPDPCPCWSSEDLAAYDIYCVIGKEANKCYNYADYVLFESSNSDGIYACANYTTKYYDKTLTPRLLRLRIRPGRTLKDRLLNPARAESAGTIQMTPP